MLWFWSRLKCFLVGVRHLNKWEAWRLTERCSFSGSFSWLTTGHAKENCRISSVKYDATGFYSASIIVQHYLFGSLGNHITISNHAEPTAGVWNPSGSIRRTDIGYWFVVEGGKPENLGKSLRARWGPTTNRTHIWHQDGMEPPKKHLKGPLKYLLMPLLGKNQLAITLHLYASIGPNLDNTHRGHI